MNRLVRSSPEIPDKSLLLIRIDFIGDYILFRNFIQALRDDPQYGGYRFSFLGNSFWRDLFEKLDGQLFDEVIWLDLAKFERNPFYRFKKLRQVTSQGYEVVLSPVYSRDFWNIDSMVKLISAKEKIGSQGNHSNISRWHKKLSDKYYTKLIPATQEVLFEFHRNQEFFQGLLKQGIQISRPEIQARPVAADFGLAEDYAVFFIGGSYKAKKWGLNNFMAVGDYLSDSYGLQIVLCGGPLEQRELRGHPLGGDGRFINLAGKTSLWELAGVMKTARLMLSNDTMAPHLAAALGKDKVFVVYRGTYYGRCIPYPKQISDGVHVICHPEIQRDPLAYKQASNAYGYVNQLDINRITPERVIDEIDEVLRHQARAGERKRYVA
ncbi:MAG: glycosyltransferase family 9 protein [Deltaproteobacteria bacterium]|nr:glycosyltransferase family 9 protein [Deltaproteobacteria bacterium]